MIHWKTWQSTRVEFFAGWRRGLCHTQSRSAYEVFEEKAKFFNLNIITFGRHPDAAIPGTSSHGYGLAVDIQNSGKKNVKSWLAENAESFGFVKEYDFEPWHFVYVKGREPVPDRVLEMESRPPED